jgi:hypothetical protein
MKTQHLFLLLILFSCSKNNNPVEEVPPKEELIFQSGFEPETVGAPADAVEIFAGNDGSKPTLSNWDEFNNHENIGSFNIQYEGGNPNQRFAKIVKDPSDAANNVLQFWLDSANVQNDLNEYYKGRIQANVYKNTGLTEIYIKVRMYFHPDFNKLKVADPTNDWLTLFEFWNNGPWLDPDNPFRITINLQKTETGTVEDLYFGVHGQVRITDKKWENVWDNVNKSFGVPIGSWLTAEIYFKEGDQSNGLFKFVITPESGTPVTIFDVVNYTHHPNGPDADGLTEFNPMKLYTSKGVIDFMRSQNGTLQIYWDDFELWKNKKL